jgi:hypothetical protein
MGKGTNVFTPAGADSSANSRQGIGVVEDAEALSDVIFADGLYIGRYIHVSGTGGGEDAALDAAVCFHDGQFSGIAFHHLDERAKPLFRMQMRHRNPLEVQQFITFGTFVAQFFVIPGLGIVPGI